MTEIFVVYKVRKEQDTSFFARMVEGHWERDRAMNAVLAYDATMSPSERRVGWNYEYAAINMVGEQIKIDKPEDQNKTV